MVSLFLYHQERGAGIPGCRPAKYPEDSTDPMDLFGNHHGGHRLEPWSHSGSMRITSRLCLFPTNPRRPLPGPRCWPHSCQPHLPSRKWPINKNPSSNMPDLQGPSEPANVTWAPQEQRDGRSIPHFFKIWSEVALELTCLARECSNFWND